MELFTTFDPNWDNKIVEIEGVRHEAIINSYGNVYDSTLTLPEGLHGYFMAYNDNYRTTIIVRWEDRLMQGFDRWVFNVIVTKDVLIPDGEKMARRPLVWNARNNTNEIMQRYLNPTENKNRAMNKLHKKENTQMKVELGLCEKCGGIGEKEVWYIDGKWMCENCLIAAGYEHCAECGVWEKKSDMTEIDGDWYCEACFEYEFFVCDNCGEIHHIDDMNEVNDRYGTLYVCDDCKDIFHECIECGQLFTEAMVRIDSHQDALCNRCYSEYDWHECSDCGRFVSDNDVCWDDEDDPYCPECYQSITREHNYEFRPVPIFHKTESDGSSELYFGIENEVDNGEYKSDCLSDINKIAGEQFIYMKHDGSLDDGFEIVSHPMTLKYHMEKMPWKRVFDTTLDHGFRSHDTTTCGLHIHVGREQLECAGSSSEDTVRKIVMLVERHWDKIAKFTRRRESALNDWAQRPEITDWYHDAIEAIDNGNATFADVVYDAKRIIEPWYCGSRYTAVNRCNGGTIEFRIYRGTLNHTSFIAALQFTSNICKYAMHHTMEEVLVSNWGDVATYEVYPELTAYLEKRGLTPVAPKAADEYFDYDAGVIDMPAAAIA